MYKLEMPDQIGPVLAVGCHKNLSWTQSCLSCSNVQMFADDTKLYRHNMISTMRCCKILTTCKLHGPRPGCSGLMPAGAK